VGHVPHLFLPRPWDDPQLNADDRQRHHLNRVLRRSRGSTVDYTDGVGTVGFGVWTGEGIERGEETATAPPVRRLRVAVAPPRAAERQRFLVEKLAELGTSELLWLQTLRGVDRMPRSERSRAWAVGALEQSQGAYLMEVSVDQVRLSELAPFLLVADPGGPPLRTAIEEIPADVTVAVGPEGGFVPNELPAHGVPFSLGHRILRVETAAVAAATLILLNT
jgi:RsmE family RNA methyltransferase